MRRSGEAMPTRRSMSRVRALASSLPMFVCTRSVSEIWWPTVNTGSSALIGSWKIIAMRRPRMARMARVLHRARSTPSNMMEPSRPARLFGSSRRIDRPVMVLPQPLSPTMPTRSPGAMSKSILRVACQTPCEVLKRMPRPRTDISACGLAAFAEASRCAGCSAAISPPPASSLSRVAPPSASRCR